MCLLLWPLVPSIPAQTWPGVYVQVSHPNWNVPSHLLSPSLNFPQTQGSPPVTLICHEHFPNLSKKISFPPCCSRNTLLLSFFPIFWAPNRYKSIYKSHFPKKIYILLSGHVWLPDFPSPVQSQAYSQCFGNVCVDDGAFIHVLVHSGCSNQKQKQKKTKHRQGSF